MKDLNELQIFTLIVQEMSFARAAGALEISKAAASRAVASLENRLATRLFERTTRRIRLSSRTQFLSLKQTPAKALAEIIDHVNDVGINTYHANSVTVRNTAPYNS